MISERVVGGLLLVGTADPVVLEAFAAHVPNIILVDNHDETDTYESVVSDGFTGAMTATRYLLSLGHRRIGFYLTEENVMSFRDRVRGYSCALIEAGIAPDPRWVFGVGSLVSETARTEAISWLRRDDRPTAVLTANDESALALLRIGREIGVSVPDDLSVVGFDDARFAEQMEPPLTTVRVDKEALGRLAVRRLAECMRITDAAILRPIAASPPVRHVIPVSLVIRESCRPLKSG